MVLPEIGGLTEAEVLPKGLPCLIFSETDWLPGIADVSNVNVVWERAENAGRDQAHRQVFIC